MRINKLDYPFPIGSEVTARRDQQTLNFFALDRDRWFCEHTGVVAEYLAPGIVGVYWPGWTMGHELRGPIPDSAGGWWHSVFDLVPSEDAAPDTALSEFPENEFESMLTEQ